MTNSDMVRVKLKHLVDTATFASTYLRRKGQPKIRIHAMPGSEEFLEENCAALVGCSLFDERAAATAPTRTIQQPAAKGSLRELVGDHEANNSRALAFRQSCGQEGSGEYERFFSRQKRCSPSHSGYRLTANYCENYDPRYRGQRLNVVGRKSEHTQSQFL
jgi:hypothetical protein